MGDGFSIILESPGKPSILHLYIPPVARQLGAEVLSITVYTTDRCPYCIAAKALLERAGLEFTEINLSGDSGRKASLKEKYRWRTVPMILIGDRFIGGYTELSALQKSGGLEAVLREESS